MVKKAIRLVMAAVAAVTLGPMLVGCDSAPKETGKDAFEGMGAQGQQQYEEQMKKMMGGGGGGAAPSSTGAPATPPAAPPSGGG
jgi:hypothetical protein